MSERRTKQPDETRTLTFEFSDKLATGDALTGAATITADTGLTVAGATVSGTTVTCQVSGGAHGSNYNVSCKMSTTQGDVLELDALIAVIANEN